MLNALSSNVLDNVAVVVDTYSVWSGTKKMDALDFIKIDPKDLPPEQSVTLGSKRLIDPDELKPFLQLRSRSDRTCAKYGVRTALGWVVPNDRVKALTSELMAIGDEFQKMLDDWLPEYERKVDAWIREIEMSQPEFARVLSAARIPAAAVRARFGHSLVVAQINPSAEDPADTTAAFAQGLRGSVLAAVSAEIQEYAEKLREVPDGMFKTTVRGSIQRIADRLRRFAFCDDTGLFQSFADVLERSVQGQGKIEAQEYAHLRVLLAGIRNPTSLETQMRAMAGQTPTPPLPMAPQLPLAPAPAALAVTPQAQTASSILQQVENAPAVQLHEDHHPETASATPDNRPDDATPAGTQEAQDQPALEDAIIDVVGTAETGSDAAHDHFNGQATKTIPDSLPGTDTRRISQELPAAAFAAPAQPPQRLVPGRVDLSW